MIKFIFAIILLPFTVLATPGLPKKALVMSDISQPPFEVTISEIDLSLFNGTCYKDLPQSYLYEVKINQGISLEIRNEHYESFDTAYVLFKEGTKNCDLEVDNISEIQFSVSHNKIKSLRLGVTLRLSDNQILIGKSDYWLGSGGKGLITEKY